MFYRNPYEKAAFHCEQIGRFYYSYFIIIYDYVYVYVFRITLTFIVKEAFTTMFTNMLSS